MTTEKQELVNHPSYYHDQGVLVEPYILTMVLPHPVGCALEYCIRAGKKPGADASTDLKKALFWLSRFQETLASCRASGGGYYPRKLDSTAIVLLGLFAEKNGLARVIFDNLKLFNYGSDMNGCVLTWEGVTRDCLNFLKKELQECK